MNYNLKNKKLNQLNKLISINKMSLKNLDRKIRRYKIKFKRCSKNLTKL